jgi:ABC-2 type transport system permease protein
MSAAGTAWGIVVRDFIRSTRQRSRLLAGLARPFIWVFLVGAGFNGIARLENGVSYQAFAYPGGVVMAALFGGMLTAISTVYDREFGMLRLMLASPSGVGAVLSGRTLSAAIVGSLQAGVVLACAPLAVHMTVERYLAGAAALVLVSLVSGTLGLLVASRLTSVENFGGVINVVLFPLLFLSGALYPTGSMPPALRAVARLNPVSYMVDLMRHAFGQHAEFGLRLDIGALIGSAVIGFGLTALMFDPEQRFVGRKPTGEGRLPPAQQA